VDGTDFVLFTLSDDSGKSMAQLWVTADGKTGFILDERARLMTGLVALEARTPDPSVS
jgi:hypothetical protein